MQLEIVFQKFERRGELQPGKGEVFLVPADLAERDRRDLAKYVLENGIGGLLGGEGSPARVVVSEDPTLDDMIAATMVCRIAEGADLPRGLEALAEYARLARQGLRPAPERPSGDKLPPEESIEGVFLAAKDGVIRDANRSDPESRKDLTDPGIAERFLEKWARMVAVLWEAAEGDDSGTLGERPMFSHDLAFAAEREYLSKDRWNFRQAVKRQGTRWLVSLPGTAEPVSALILSGEPEKSDLWKFWAREDEEAPTGGGHLFLGVKTGQWGWVFTTDPAYQVEIGDLARILQQAEVAKTGEASAGGGVADTRRWYLGHSNTLVAEPDERTALEDHEVLDVVRDWAQARSVPSIGSWRRRRLAVAGGLIVLAVASAGLVGYFATRSSAAYVPNFCARGKALAQPAVAQVKSVCAEIESYALIIGVCERQGKYDPLGGACTGAADFYTLLRDRYGFKKQNMRLLVDRKGDVEVTPGGPLDIEEGKPTRKAVFKAIRELAEESRTVPWGQLSNFIFYYGGHGHQEDLARGIGYLVLSGFDADNPETTGISMTHLSQLVRERITASHQILIVDCCYSGFATLIPRGESLQCAEDERIFELWKRRAHAILTAGKSDQLAWEKEHYSIFTEQLRNGLGTPLLADENGDGIVTDAELGKHLATAVSKKIEEVARGAGTVPGYASMTPQYFRGIEGDDVGQFLFIPRR